MPGAIRLPGCSYFWLREGVLDEDGINRLESEVDEAVRQAAERALAAAKPRPDSVTRYVYSPDLDPRSAEFETAPVFAFAAAAPQASEMIPATEPPATAPRGAAVRTMAELINACLKDEMRRDPRIVVFGEDVADCSREEYSGREAGEGQRRGIQADGGTAERVRPGARI